MPVHSRPVRDSSVHFRLLQQYLVLLKKYPILTKSVTRSVHVMFLQFGGLKTLNICPENFPPSSVLHLLLLSVFRLFITGPVSHLFYQLMEVWIPTKDPFCIVKRLLLDRLIFAPGFLLLFYFVMNILEAKGWDDFEKKMRRSYWTALKMNWKVWTPFQFININFVPVQFRVLFANMIALFWYAYLASVRK
uniref:Peroxisomal membrane protein 2 n=1 Tax=Amphilophus citrinellus TaxID=61819 RepID=A0A3Q0SIL4_AMPCI